MQSEKHQRGFRGNAPDLPGRFQSIHDRHLVIQDHDIWIGLFNLLDGDLAILSFTTNTQFRVVLNGSSKQVPYGRIVIGDEDIERHLATPICLTGCWPGPALRERTATREG